jgi:hypothetical protein
MMLFMLGLKGIMIGKPLVIGPEFAGTGALIWHAYAGEKENALRDWG